MLRNLVFTFLIGLAPVAALAESSVHTMVTSANQVHISYKLADDGDAFINALLDHARAGQVVRIRHNIVFNSVKGWGWGDMATAEVGAYVSYSLFDDRFSVGAAPDSLHTVSSVEDVKSYVLSVEDVPLVAADKLRTGDEYTVSVTATIEANDDKGGWTSYLPLKHIFRKELHEAFYYIAR